MHASPSVASFRWPQLVAAVTLTLIVGAGVTWAAMTVLSPPREVLDATKYTFVKAVEGEVGSQLALNTTATWTPSPVGANSASGIVTTVNVAPGQEVAAGQVLYTVGLRPTVVAAGAIPSFRSLTAGDFGADVSQLQGVLSSVALFKGAADGKFGASTERAVRAWQKGLGVPSDGIVQIGDVIYVPTLPSRISLDPEVITTGKSVAGGEPVVTALPTAPDFMVEVTPAQAQLMPTGTRVEVTGPAAEIWEGFVAVQTIENQVVKIALTGANGTSVCRDTCGSIAVVGQTSLSSRAITVEPVSGTTLPTAAIHSDALGALSVMTKTGKRISVEVIASARGMSIVEGIPLGSAVRIPAGD